MRGGLYNTVFVIAVVIVGVIAIAGMIIFLQSGTIQTQVNIKTDILKLNKIDLAYVADSCLKNGEDFIDSSFIETLGSQSLKELCGTGADFGVKIEDVHEPSKSWKIKFDDFGNQSEAITTTIKVGDEIHLGRLYASF